MLLSCLVLALSLQPVEAEDLSTAPPDEARSVEISRVFPFWEDYQALDEDRRDAFSISYRFSTVTEPEGGGAWRFWIDTGAGPYPLPLGPMGSVTPPFDDASLPEGELLTDAPEGGVAVAMSLSPSGPLRERYSVDDLERSIAQSNNAMRSLMGLRSLVMPRLETVHFVFDGAAPDAVLVMNNGEEREVLTVYENVITFTPRDRANRGGAELRFGTSPISVTLEAVQ